LTGMIFSLDKRSRPMEATAIPFPNPDKTPPVTMMYLVGISVYAFTETMVLKATYPDSYLQSSNKR